MAAAEDTERWHLVLPAAPESAAEARRAVAAYVGPMKRAKDLEILVSEAVSYAVQHGGGADGADVVVEVAVLPDHVEVRTLDGSYATPWRRSPDGAAEALGLRLIEEIADGFGVSAGSVWFRLAR